MMANKILSKVWLVVIMIMSQIVFSQAQDQGKIKVVLSGGTEITDIGPGCEVSINLFKDAFDYIALMTEMEVDYTFCTGSNFNKEYILQAVEDVDHDTYDAIVFFNSSHGFNYLNTPSKHTFFVAHPTAAGSMSAEQFKNYGVSLEKEIYKKLKKKGAPVVLVFSESCNKEINMEAPPMYKTMNPNIAARLKELFQGTEAHVISSSSEYGQYSYTDNEKGGIYVNSLLHAMNDVTTTCDKSAWDKVMVLTRKYVMDYSKDLDGGQAAIYDIEDATPISLEEPETTEKPKKKKKAKYIQSGIKLKN